MPRLALSLALVSSLALAGCMSSPDAQRQAAGTAVGGVAGLAVGKALGLGDGWVAVTTIAGATAGTLVARNTANNMCAYADGRGGYVRRPC